MENTHPDNVLDLLLVLRAILLEQVVCFGLCGRLRVGIVQQVLDAQQDLFDGDGGLPRLFLVQDAEADGAGRVDVRVEERRHEFAWTSRQLRQPTNGSRGVGVATFRRFSRVLCDPLVSTSFHRYLPQGTGGGGANSSSGIVIVAVGQTFRKDHIEFEQPPLPKRLFFAGDTAAPLHQVQPSLRRFDRLCEEAKRVVFSPLLSAF